MYFWNTSFGEGPWGAQGDLQHRNWNLGGDLEQIMLRGGITYQPKGQKLKFTQGYAHIISGQIGSSTTTSGEHRIYQELLLPHSVGKHFYFTHRYRFEQRFVDNQDFRTRLRYNLFLNVTLNKEKLEKGTVYLALYNELFMNLQKEIGNGRTVEYFDRNRFYTAVGYGLRNNLRVQLGYMEQAVNTHSKGQIQLSLHHKI